MITAFSLKVAAAIAGLALVGGIGYGTGVYLGYFAIPFVSDPPEHSARYYPANVIAYSWMTLNPGGGQRRHMTEMFSRMQDFSTVREWQEELEDAIEDEFDVEPEDLGAWLGTEISVAAMNFDSRDGTIDVAGTVDVRNRGAAEDFIDKVLDRLEEDGGLDFDRDDYEDFDTWVDESRRNDFELSLALSESLLVVASAEHILKTVLDRVSGKQERTLASDEAFQEARAALPKRRFMSTYVDYENLFDAIEDAAAVELAELGTAGEQTACGDLLTSIPNWVVMSLGAFERGIVAEVASPLTSSGWPAAPELPNAAELLPADALGFAAVSFNPTIGEWRESLRECGIADLYGDDLWEEVLGSIPPDTQLDWFEEIDRSAREASAQPQPEPLGRDATLADALDIGLWAGSRLARFDIETDLLKHLEGTAIASVLHVPSDLERPLDAVAMVSYRPENADELDEALTEIASWLEDEFDLDFDSANVGAERNARILDLRDSDDIGYDLGYVLHGGFLTFGTTERAIETVVSRQQGEGGALATDGEYRRATASLPGDRDMLAYIGLKGIVGLVSDAGGIDRRTEGMLEETLGAVSMSTSSNGGVSRATLAVTFFPER